MSGCRVRSDVTISGYQPRLGEQVVVQDNRVGANYFSTVGMRLLDGRDFDSRDTASSPRVAIVNQAMVRQYFSGRPAIGEKFGDDKPDIEIVGIVEDARVNSVREPAAPMAYYPMRQGVYYGSLEVRTAGDPQWMIAEVRKAVSEVEPNLPVGRITPLAQRVDSNLNQERLVVMLSSLFGILALGLAAFGLYGVMSYAVSRRTAELGLRLALGSPRSLVLWMILKESLLLILLGLAVGLPVVLAASRLISGMLFDVNPHDAATLSAAVLILAVVAVLSAWAPARRASRVNPMVALRYE
jgi:predicted permease